MRLHLIIQRHGLPVTRILWTTTSSSSLDGAAQLYKTPATASSIASTRAPNALFANGGYTIAQLLEDVNEVVPLETEPNLFGDDQTSGQWGLEDYVVEVAGSECLHFMEVEGLLRDDDVLVIRALQIADLKTRRLSGRHQISADGRHLIDGVPFGRPYLKRSVSSRPAISIPPRKKRRTLGGRVGYEEEESEFPLVNYLGDKDISALREAYREESVPEDRALEDDDDVDDEDYYEDFHEGQEDEKQDEDEEDGDGTVIRHPVDYEEAQVYEDEEEISDFDDRDLTDELQDLKEDLQASGFHPDEPRRLSTKDPEQSLHEDIEAKQAASQVLRTTDGREPGSRKSVRFSKGGELTSPASQKTEESFASAKESAPLGHVSSEESEDSSSSESSSSDDTSDEDDDDDDDSTSSSGSSTSDSESSSSSSAASESEDEEVQQVTKVNPPGYGSSRTKKSNQRMKMRRRLSKLKEFGILPEQADFSALREWEETNGNWDASLEAKFVMDSKRQSKEQEKSEFEAKRQQLLRELEAGGVDIDEFAGQKHNQSTEVVELEQEQPEEDTNMDQPEAVTESARKRSLDVASTRRMLFGSLGVKTPYSKEDEEATRKKLAGKPNNFQTQRAGKREDEPAEPVEDDLEENWQDKLDIRATECIFDDIELTAPPFPFKQRWDREAHEIIGKRNGWGRNKRKRKQKVQVYEEPEEEEEYWDGYEDGYDYGNDQYENGELQLQYDDAEQPIDGMNDADKPEDAEDDLPSLPADIGPIPDFAEEDLKKGAIIAFKQLDMSKDTNWQPKVSEYRVAEIHEVIEDGIINVRLARRDRRQAKYRDYEEDEDEDDGQRRYSGFEMPGFDDDDEGEDDGFRELAFTELIEPKLLQPGVADHTSNFQAIEEPAEKGHYQEAVAVVVPSVPIDSTESVTAAKGPGGSPAIKSPEFAGFQSPRADEHELAASFEGSNKDSDSAANSTSSIKNDRGKKKKRKTTKSQKTTSLEDTFVPNPFYEIDKAHEERRRQESEKAKENTIDALDEPSFAGFSSSPAPTPRKLRNSQRLSTQAGHETSPISSMPETQWHDDITGDQGNVSQMSDFVDLTQSSPRASPDRNGGESLSSQPKSAPKSRRQTRLSSSHVQMPQEASGSLRAPTKKRRKT